MRYEEGDRVIISSKGDKPFPDGRLGDVGRVERILDEDGDSYDYQIRFDDEGWNLFLERELKSEEIVKCGTHGRKLYHDKREEYFCPWCEGE